MHAWNSAYVRMSSATPFGAEEEEEVLEVSEDWNSNDGPEYMSTSCAPGCAAAAAAAAGVDVFVVALMLMLTVGKFGCRSLVLRTLAHSR
jgi:hypothetical protein